MKNRDLAEVLIKILGIYALLQALPLLQYIAFAASSFFVTQSESTTNIIQLISITPFFANFIVGGYLIKNGEKISKKIIKKESKEVLSNDHIDKESLQTIIFSSVGLLIIILAVPKAIQSILSVYFYANETMVGEAERIFNNNWPNVLGTILQVIIGFIVFFQAQGITNLWRSLQSMRYEKRQ